MIVKLIKITMIKINPMKPRTNKTRIKINKISVILILKMSKINNKIKLIKNKNIRNRISQKLKLT